MNWMIIIVPLVYIVAVYVVSKLTVEKLNARSGLFGAGIVTMSMGFILHELVDFFESFGYWYAGSGWYDLLPSYYILSYGFLIMGLCGVVMIAVDLLKMINDLQGWVGRVDDKASKAGPEEKHSYEKVPAWKRISEDEEK